MSELIPVNIIIGDRNYRIRIAPSDEEKLRRTVKTINDKIVEFKTEFAGKDMQDYIAMVMVWYATQPEASGSSSAAFLSSAISDKLAQFEKQLDRSLEPK